MKNANLLSWFSRLWVCGLLFGLVAGCSKTEITTAESYKTVQDYFPIKVGDRVVQMQIAVLESEMEHGLMGRKDLVSGKGMIFVYPAKTQMSFYMRNTPTALDIGYFGSDGVLREIYPMYPFDETTIRSRSKELQFALELIQGDFSTLGIRSGAKLDLKALADALTARGLKPKNFGLGPEQE